MIDIIPLLSLVLIFSITILYSFAYIEILFVIHRILCKEKTDISGNRSIIFLFIPLLLFASAYFARTISPQLRFDLLFISLALFFSSIALFALGLIVKEEWEKKIKEMNIKLLSTYSIWIITSIYILTFIVCFLLALVSLIEYIEIAL
jgi:hypothetical protein